MVTSSTAFSLSRSESLKALISACASDNSLSLSANTNTHKKNKNSKFKTQKTQKKKKKSRRRTLRIELHFRTSNFILEAIELHLHRIRTVQQIHELVGVHARRPHSSSAAAPPCRASPLLERSRHRQRGAAAVAGNLRHRRSTYRESKKKSKNPLSHSNAPRTTRFQIARARNNETRITHHINRARKLDLGNGGF